MSRLEWFVLTAGAGFIDGLVLAYPERIKPVLGELGYGAVAIAFALVALGSLVKFVGPNSQ